MHRTISISCFNVLSRVNDFDRCCFLSVLLKRRHQFWNVENLTSFYFVISKLFYIYYGEHLEVLLNVYSLEMFYLNLHFFTFEFQLQTLWDTVYESNINVTFCCCKTSSYILFSLYSMSTLKFFSYIVAFIFTKHGLHFLQIICFVKLFPHSLVMDPTGQENIARNINTWARQPSVFLNR